MIRREEARLNRVFRRLLLLSLAAPGTLYACSSSSTDNSPGADAGAGNDATAGSDAQAMNDGAQLPNDGARLPNDGAQLPNDGAAQTDGARLDAAISDAGVDTSACDPSPGYITDASFVSIDGGPLHQCYTFEDLPCGLPAATQTSACYLYLGPCHTLQTWEGGFVDCRILATECNEAGVWPPNTPTTLAYGLCNGVGRRHAGFEEPRRACVAGASPLGEYFAQAAHLEAASVFAFRLLRNELATLGAPSSLVRMAERSARDEVRHTRVTARLARRFGGAPAKAKAARQAPRTLEEVARENAVEGCVRETFGAMVATWQAEHAEDASVKREMKRIAADETRHAALAWAVAKWADSQLDEAARARVKGAQREAITELAREVSREAPAELVRTAGLPTHQRATELVAAMEQALWAA